MRAADIERAQAQLARLMEGANDEIALPLSERDLKRIIVGYLNSYEAGLASAQEAWLRQMRRVRTELEREQSEQLGFAYQRPEE